MPLAHGEKLNFKTLFDFKLDCQRATTTAKNVAILPHILPMALTASQFVDITLPLY